MSEMPPNLANLSPGQKRALLRELLSKKANGLQAIYPLSYGQRGLWLVHQMDPASAAYNIATVARIVGDLNVPALRESFQKLVNRHPSLRTTFAVRNGSPVQQVHKQCQAHFEIRDASAWDAAELRERLTAEAHRPFDLEQGPMLRVCLFLRAPGEHILLAAVHHIVGDFWSMAVLLQEMGILYQALANGSAPVLPPLRLQYSDYVSWQREMLSGPDGERLRQYWGKQLAGPLPVLNLRTDHPRPPVQTFRGSQYEFTLEMELVDRLKQFAKAEGTTLFAILLAAFQTLLHRYTSQEDILVGSPAAGRSTVEFESIVGYFINPVVLRSAPASHLTFRRFVGQVRETVLAALEHQDYPFPLLIERLQPDRDASRSPLFQVMFNMPKVHRLEERHMSPFVLGDMRAHLNLGGLKLEFFALEQRSAMFDILLAVVETGGSISGTIYFNADLFELSTVERMGLHFRKLVESGISGPDRTLSELPLLTEQEERRLLIDWNHTETEFPNHTCMHALFELQAARHPGRTAVTCGSQRLTYVGLNRWANHAAWRLIGSGVGPDRVVAVLSERGIGLLASMLAIFKAGGCYLPLDPHWPDDRLQHVLQQSGARVVLASLACAPALSQVLDAIPMEQRPEMLLIGADSDAAADAPNPEARCSPNDLAYVIYTSGSTGIPKGAMIEHRGMLNHLYAKVAALDLTGSDILAQNASQCFDISVWQFLAGLLVGASVHIIDDEVAHAPAQLFQTVSREQISILEIVPSILRALFEQRPGGGLDFDLSALRWLLLTGEEMRPHLCRQWFRSYTHVRLMNAYGPTECSDDVTHFSICEAPSADLTTTPIGRPIPNTRLYVVDANMQLVPIGIPGELCVGGIAVGRGYLNDASRTTAAFGTDPFAADPGGRLYHTGDLVRYRADGNLEYLGRLDRQVKVRGFRIELAEVEAVLSRFPGVGEALVVARADHRGEPQLVAYVAADEDLPVSELRAALREKLPDYMVPAAFVFLRNFPLTPNGKIDCDALPPPAWQEACAESGTVAPHTPVETELARIWCEVLGVPRAGIHDNFFTIGGHSLTATLLLSKIEERLAVKVPLRLFVETPTIAGLADVLDHVEQAAAEPDLSADAVLDPAIHPEAQPASARHPSRILLTGSTGFLGAYLLRELLDQTAAVVHCLVRAADEADAGERVRRNLKSYGLWDPLRANRITALPGDLSKPLLGLPVETFDQLAAQVDVIYHNGATVNLMYSYSTLKAVNVQGTQEVLRLACSRKTKPVHFISTLGVFDSRAYVGATELKETELHGRAESVYGGYAQSKWLAEQLVLQARSRGLPAAIYRPATITGDTRTGASNPDDVLCRMIKGVIQLGYAPELDVELDLTPVDYVSRAIVHLSRQIGSSNRIFHLTNPHRSTFRDLANFLRSYGYRIEELSYARWREFLNAHTGGAAQGPFYPLVPMLSEMDARAGQDLLERYSYQRRPAVDDANTRKGLADVALVCPPVNAELISTYLSFLVSRGFLDIPHTARGDMVAGNG